MYPRNDLFGVTSGHFGIVLLLLSTTTQYYWFRVASSESSALSCAKEEGVSTHKFEVPAVEKCETVLKW